MKSIYLFVVWLVLSCSALAADFVDSVHYAGVSPELVTPWASLVGLSPQSETTVNQTVVSGDFQCQRKYCKAMLSCSEAVFNLRQCGVKRLDRDGDGIPCESICGKSHAAMNRKLAAGR